MLLVMDRIGGGILLVLLFTLSAWTDTSEKARSARLATGAITVGVVLGVLFFKVWPGIIWFSNVTSTRAWFALAGVPLILVAVTFSLESLRKRFS
jgi:hypothetical protein